MFVNSTGLIAAAMSVLCCVLVFCGVRGWSIRSRIAGLILFSLAAITGAGFSFYYLIGDPIKGQEVVSEEELKYRYDFTGFYLEISE